MGVLSKIKTDFDNKFLIKFSIATAEDIVECNSVIEKSYAYSMQKNGFAFNHYEDFIENLKEILELGGKTFIVKYRKQIVGTVSYKPKEIDKWYFTGNTYELCHFAVLPEYQKMGLGGRLIEMIVEDAKQAGVPIILVTPEKNKSVIKYYEKKGFKRVRMYFAKEHYSCRLIMYTAENQPFTDDELREEYKKSAFLCLMKHYKECNEVSDLEVLKEWNNKFYKYYKDEPEDVQLEMRKRFRKRGTTPRKFVRQREKKIQEEQEQQEQTIM